MENAGIAIQISVKHVSKCPIDNKPALVQIMAWHWTGDKPISKPMMASSIDTSMHHSGVKHKNIISKERFIVIYASIVYLEV